MLWIQTQQCSASVQYSKSWLTAVPVGILFQSHPPYATHPPPPYLVEKSDVHITVTLGVAKQKLYFYQVNPYCPPQ